MFTTLIAVLVALALGHVAPHAALLLRRFDGFRHWLGWLEAHAGASARGASGVALAVLPAVLLMGLLAWALHGVLYGLPSLLLGVVVMAGCWGPRDLDRDVEAVIDADEPALRQAALQRLQAAGGSLRDDLPSLVDATVYNALRRWFGVLLWFLLLGPAGALGYRLLALMAVSPMRAQVAPETQLWAQRLLGWLEWPVAQLMAVSLALVGNFDTAWKAWRMAHGERWRQDIGFLGAVARASVNAELREEAHDYTATGLLPVWQRLPELRDAMSLVWRMLLLWLSVLALLVIAGWVT